MRPDNDEYFLDIAFAVSKRSTCARRAVGCVLVNGQNFIIATAYNSVPHGIRNCTDLPCPGSGYKSGEGLHLCIAQHAETLALIRCANIYHIVTCYVTTSPCVDCTRRLLDTSCRRIVYREHYPHEEASRIWTDASRTWLHK